MIFLGWRQCSWVPLSALTSLIGLGERKSTCPVKPVPLSQRFSSLTSMSVLLIVRLKCTLAASHTATDESRWICRRDRRTDGRTPDRYITLSAMDAANETRRNKAEGTGSVGTSLSRLDWKTSIEIVQLRRDWLILGWVTVGGEWTEV